MPEVPITDVSFTDREDFARRLVAAFMANGVSHAGAQILTAHVAVSTGWGKSVDNYRIAGIKADAAWRATKPYTTVTGCECVEGMPNQNDPKCVCAPGKGQQYKKSYWRAYGSLREAAADFVGLLKVARYQAALALAQAGDTEYFAAVGRAGWYTADPARVKISGESALAEVQRYLGSTPVAQSGILPLVAVAGILWWYFA